MKFTTVVSIFIGIIVIMVACNSKSSLKEKIAGQEQELFDKNQQEMDESLMEKLTTNYVKYADKHPGDSLAAGYLFKAADMNMNLGQTDEAMDQLNRILKNYESFPKRPECLFMKAYIYENHRGELANARRYYQAFLEKYPDHAFADDVEMSLKHLGKSPEELVKEFEKQP